MSVGNVFKTILRDIGIGVQIFMGIEPIVYNTLPAGAQGKLSQVTDDLTQIAVAVQTTQAVVAIVASGGTPEQVKAAAAPLVNTVIQKSELLLGKKVHDTVLYAKALDEITQGMVDLLESVT